MIDENVPCVVRIIEFNIPKWMIKKILEINDFVVDDKENLEKCEFVVELKAPHSY